MSTNIKPTIMEKPHNVIVRPQIRKGETPGEKWEMPKETGETIGET